MNRLLTALALAATIMGGSLTADAQDKRPIVLISGDLSDPFFGAIKCGADDAAKNLGVEYTYLAANIDAVALSKAIEAVAC